MQYKLSIQKLARERADIHSCYALAQKIGGSRETAANLWFGRVAQVRLETLTKLCELFHCEIGELFEKVPAKEAPRAARVSWQLSE